MRLMNMKCKEVEDYFAKNQTVIVATGSIENHGSHNPLGVDTLVPDQILAIVEQKSNIMIAPTIPYGACDSLVGFAGTISIGGKVLYRMIDKIIKCLHSYGCRRIIFLNGHGGNKAAIDKASLKWHKKGVKSACMDWWLMLLDFNPEWRAGHGGFVETSATMAINPHLVDLSLVREMELLNPYGDHMPSAYVKTVRYKGVSTTISGSIKEFTSNGWFGKDHPKESSAEKGRQMIQAVAEYIVVFAEEFDKKLPPYQAKN